ncbi:CHAT domain-containing protein [Actinoplanes hulinensis]|uniref:CHAT domain-containing protein n=1 Tax=Actinoplanes hulinensis TaxID=1144547 RepID=A0ABS7B911_9ACTN|nr:tetratricopeptide repeat protein [Actinoplanes hulinensis]MBW6437435.1 CHAT domain-containing protein [Actinoplanes hulinensis]
MGLALDDTGFEVLLGTGRIGPRRPLSADDEALLADFGDRYIRAVQSNATDDVFLTLGRDLWSWLDGDARQLAALVASAPSPFVFEIRGPKNPSDRAWPLLRAPFELLAPPDGGFLAENALSRFCVVRRLGDAVTPPAPDGFRLGLAFMASSPSRQHELDFEAEEAAILEAVDATRVDLIVEDTGNPTQLGRRLADLGGLPAVHLSCHGINRWRPDADTPPAPALMMEDEVGDDLPTTAAHLVDAMTKPPRFLFISACLTATPANEESHLPPGAGRRTTTMSPTEQQAMVAHSMATSLISAGIPAVLGWDGSVGDRAATAFARELYSQLSTQADVAVAVGNARRALLNSAEPPIRADWHLARLWLGPAGGGPLVSGNRARSRVTAVHATKIFLDRKSEVPVAAPNMFVGRRPELQRALRALRSDGRAGVLLHGQGRLGKSSLAARIADRRPDLTPAVVFGDYSPTAILDAVAEAVKTNPAARDLIEHRREDVRERPEALEPLLTDLLSGPCAQTDTSQRPLLLIIDDLEQILEIEPQGLPKVVAASAPVLAAVLRAFDPAITDSRLLLTSRFQFTLDNLQSRLEQIPLRPLSATAQQKLLNRQQEKVTPERRTERATLAVRAVAVSRGNPGLQDLIGQRLVFSDHVDLARAEAAVSEMESYLHQGELPAETEVRAFLEGLALDTLLTEAGPEHEALLRDLTLFDIPIPESVAALLADRTGGSTARLLALGLVDAFPDAYRPETTALTANTLVVGRLRALTDDESEALAIATIDSLFLAWGSVVGHSSRPAYLDLQLVRLALAANNAEVIACCAADALLSLDRGPAAIGFEVGNDAVALLDDNAVAVPIRLLRAVAAAARLSGNGAAAEQLFDRAARLVQSDEAGTIPLLDRARAIADQGSFLIRLGRMKQAEELVEQAHQWFAAAGAEAEAAASQGDLAEIRYLQGDYDEVLRIRQEVQLPVYERLGDVRSTAVTWGSVADIKYQLGDYDEALRIRQEVELPVYERLGDARSIAVTWGDIADIHLQRRDYDEAARLQADRLAANERLGDLDGIAAAKWSLALIRLRQGDSEAAIPLVAEAFEGALKLRRADAIAIGGSTWGRLLLSMGRREEAIAVLRVSLAAAEKIEASDIIARIRKNLDDAEDSA